MSLEIALVGADAMRGLAQVGQTKTFPAQSKDVTTKNVNGRIYTTSPRPSHSSLRR
ncbi:MAG: hypothetical protein ABJP79_00415 [Tateyamaria sp.]|uniref:hypothetical protein n=1 Tax=Tateyamaria sp. TaxID=1929288 RepID=UPI0032A102D8